MTEIFGGGEAMPKITDRDGNIIGPSEDTLLMRNCGCRKDASAPLIIKKNKQLVLSPKVLLARYLLKKGQDKADSSAHL